MYFDVAMHAVWIRGEIAKARFGIDSCSPLFECFFHFIFTFALFCDIIKHKQKHCAFCDFNTYVKENAYVLSEMRK